MSNEPKYIIVELRSEKETGSIWFRKSPIGCGTIMLIILLASALAALLDA